MPGSHLRFGLILFGIYLVIYGGFVLLNAFAPDVMKMTPIPGVNLAIIYGFGLILTAFGLAMIYGFVARQRGIERPHADSRQEQKP